MVILDTNDYMTMISNKNNEPDTYNTLYMCITDVCDKLN